MFKVKTLVFFRLFCIWQMRCAPTSQADSSGTLKCRRSASLLLWPCIFLKSLIKTSELWHPPCFLSVYFKLCSFSPSSFLFAFLELCPVVLSFVLSYRAGLTCFVFFTFNLKCSSVQYLPTFLLSLTILCLKYLFLCFFCITSPLPYQLLSFLHPVLLFFFVFLQRREWMVFVRKSAADCCQAGGRCVTAASWFIHSHCLHVTPGPLTFLSCCSSRVSFPKFLLSLSLIQSLLSYSQLSFITAVVPFFLNLIRTCLRVHFCSLSK